MTTRTQAERSDEAGGHDVPQRVLRAYWRQNLMLMGALLTVWLLVSFGAGILFRDFLDQWSIGGAPLGFWFAQQGAIYVFVILIFVYSAAMHRIEQRFDVDDDEG